jgi:hypothetical protein
MSYKSSSDLCFSNIVSINSCFSGSTKSNSSSTISEKSRVSKKEDRLRIIDQSTDCDVFINNAHSDDFSQTELLLDMWHKWNHLNKKIINVGSDISLYNVSVLQSRPHLLEYRMHKMSLKNLCEDLTILPSNLKIEYASFGYVGTDRIFKKYPNMPSNMYITVDEAVRIILEKM